MSDGERCFGGFRLDLAERRLTRGGVAVELSGRYLDALILLSGHPGTLITKDRFMAEVWRGIPVTDEALTQAIRTLRRVLGDDAARPRFIETVPKHGYRFIAAVEQGDSAVGTRPDLAGPPLTDDSDVLEAAELGRGSEIHLFQGTRGSASPGRQEQQATAATRTSRTQADTSYVADSAPAWLQLAGAGLVGGAAAGLVGGIGYGLLAATNPPAGTGAISVVLVITCLCLLIGLLGGLGVGAGVASASRLSGGRLFPFMLGGALGGLLVGALGRLVGLDAFTLLVGSRPLAITGGSEGLLIGALAGAGAWLGQRRTGAAPETRAVQGAGLGAVAGLLVIAGGGQMMAGSLAVLAAAHPGTPLGTLLGDGALPPALRLMTGAVEGAVFIGALTLAFALVDRRIPPRS